MADLHREGIAHNDAHPGNLFVGSVTSKGRWVDFGLSQASPKAALAEALGAFANPSMFHDKDFQRHLAEDSAASVAPDHISGNWQTREWNAAGTWRTDKIQARPGREALAKELPVLGKILKNLITVNKMLEEKYGLNEGEILAIYAHGIRSPMSSYQQGPWQKLTDEDAQKIIQALYKGV
jgi:serine/threonine protein kinase